MKIGVLGPAEDARSFREAASFLLLEAGADQIVFLGEGKFLYGVIDAWAVELGRDGENAFLLQAAEVALEGSVEEIHALLRRDDVAAKLGAIRKLPPPPARAIELVDDRIVLFVHDKAVLDEEDIANASAIVYGKSDESLVKRFGKRAFASPGPLSRNHVLFIEPGAEGLTLSIFDLGRPKPARGTAIVRETLGGTATKLTVV